MEDLRLAVAPDLDLVLARPEHAGELLALIQRNRHHIGRFLPKVVEIDSPEKVQAHLAHCRERCRERELFEFHVFRRSELCGIVRLNYFEWEARKAALSYLLDAAQAGRGIITLAARRVLQFGFQDLGLHRVELRCATTNTASRRVAERLGFTREGELREADWLAGAPVNELIFGLLRREFEA